MSTGRSPYPTRSRRRQQALQAAAAAASTNGNPEMSSRMDDSHSTSTTPRARPSMSPRNASNYSMHRLGQSLVQARLSPAASTTAQKRFFDKPTTTTTTAPSTSPHRPPPLLPTTIGTKPSTEKLQLCDGIDLETLRTIARDSLPTATTAASPATAVFYASMLYAKTQSKLDALLYAQALLQNQQAKRCVRLLEQAGWLSSTSTDDDDEDDTCHLEGVLLAAQALSSLGEWQSVLTLLEDAYHYRVPPTTSSTASTPLDDEDDIAWQALAQAITTHYASNSHSIHPLARLCCYRGQAYAEMGHPVRAAKFWKRSLQIDPQCVQALDLLLERGVIPPEQVLQTVLSLDFNGQPGMEWLRAMYLARVHVAAPTNSHPVLADTANTEAKSDDPFWHDASSLELLTPIPTNTTDGKDASSHRLFFGDQPQNTDTSLLPPPTDPTQIQVETALDSLLQKHKLNHSSEVLAMAAQQAYRQYDLKRSLDYCQQLAAMDPLCQTAGLVYVSTLVALGHKRTLFRLAHEWVDAAPKSAKAWFAVGAYYYSCQRYHVAQRHFCRATRLDPHCSDAWIAFGTSFAACDESDQALASFRAAQRLAPGDATSLLYMGMEYLRTNHLTLAHHFLTAALKASSGTNRLCRSEMGVWYLAQHDFASAIQWFCQALGQDEQIVSLQDLSDLLDSVRDDYWEGTLFNLAHAYRKLRKFEEAQLCLQRCLALRPDNASAYTALGFCQQLQGDCHAAMDTYHQALSYKPDDPFAQEMLHRALKDALGNANFFPETTLPPADTVARPESYMESRHQDGTSYLEEGLSLSVDTHDSDVDMG